MKITDKTLDLTQGDILKRMIQYFLPLLAASLFQQLYTTVDAIIVGQFAGKIGLASIDAVYNLLKLPVNFLIGISTGATIIISHCFGAKLEENLSKAIYTAVCFAFIGGLMLSILGVLTAPACLMMLEVPKEILKSSLAYTRIYFGGLVFSMLYNIGAGIMRALGDSKTPFYVLIVSGIFNLILNLIFVGVLHGGAPGAAVATVIAQVISAIIVLCILIRSRTSSKLQLKKRNYDRSILKSILKTGLPVGLQAALYPIANMVIQACINSTGTDNIAAWALCGKLDFLIWLVADSLAIAVSTFVAQNYGAQQYTRSRKGINWGLAFTLGLIVIISAILYLWCEPLGKLFINAQDTSIITLAAQFMRFLSPMYFLYVFGEIYSSAIRGTGETFKPMIITLITTCVTRIVWILFLFPIYPSIFIVLGSYPASWFLSSAAFIIYYHTCKNRLIPVTDTYPLKK